MSIYKNNMKITAARAISFILHPMFLAVLATFLISYYGTKNTNTSLIWAAVMGIVVFFIFLFEYYGIRHKFFSAFDVPQRRQRRPLYAFVLFIFLLFIILVLIFHGPIELLAGGIYIIIGIIVFSTVNKKIKVSVHVAGISAFFVSMGLLFGGLYYLGLLLIPVIAWSRVVLHRHTLSEVSLGAALGAILTLTIYGVLQFLR